LRAEAEYVSTHYDYRQHLDARAAHGRLVTDGLVDALALAGTPERCAERLAELGRIGVKHVMLHASGSDRRGMVARFIAEVMPRLR
jgi:alkanesulfonate monooxygenase SsuD/methylene tetrahydromethanopterin reductase-like flavin-dependent oxidoreductase (luciferase family)